jgi:hypothetical protein
MSFIHFQAGALWSAELPFGEFQKPRPAGLETGAPTTQKLKYV